MEKNKASKRAQKQTYLEWYGERKPFTISIKEALFAIIGIPVCIIIAYIACVILIGNGSYSYSDDTYKHIEASIDAYVQENQKPDLLALKQAGCTLVFSDKDETPTLVCTIKNGYFKAKVTATLSSNYKVLDKERNFKDFDHYKRHYSIVFGAISIGGGFGLWVLTTLSWNGLLVLRAKVEGKKSKPNKTSETSEGQEEATQ